MPSLLPRIIFLGVISIWVTLFVVLGEDINSKETYYEELVYQSLLFLGLTSLYFFIGRYIVPIRRNEVMQRLWQFFIVGASLLVIYAIINSVSRLWLDVKNPIFATYFHVFNLLILNTALIYGIFTVRSFLLKNRNRRYDRIWQFFIVWLFFSNFLIFIPEWQGFQIFYLVVGVLIAIYLSFAPKWIAYLNIEQKRSATILLFAVLVTVVLLWISMQRRSVPVLPDVFLQVETGVFCLLSFIFITVM